MSKPINAEIYFLPYADVLLEGLAAGSEDELAVVPYKQKCLGRYADPEVGAKAVEAPWR